LPVNLDRIPAALKEHGRWVTWNWTFNPNKGGHHHGWDKPPKDPKTGKLASSTNPDTWSTFEDAVISLNCNALDGVGFNLHDLDGIVVHDLDGCRDPETGVITHESMNIVRLVGAYWEISPSGTGIRGICRGYKTGCRVEASKGGSVNGAQYDGSAGRYITLTGHLLAESTADICDAHPSGIEAAYALMFPTRESQPGPKAEPKSVNFDDLTLLEKAWKAANGAKFSRLWDGDFSNYQSQSEADLALCSHLAFWTGGDIARIDALFQQSGLMREKWIERRGNLTYGQSTIAKALQEQRDYYRPHGHMSNNDAKPKEWDAIQELPDLFPPVPRLPGEMVPGTLRPRLADIADRACIPLEMVAVPALVSAGSIIGRRVGIKPNRNDEYLVVPNLWGYVCARPGALKTYAIESGINPLNRLAAKATDRYMVAVDLAEVQKAALEAEIATTKSRMKKATEKKDARQELEDLKLTLANLIGELRQLEPVERRYISQDATVPKLGELLQKNPVGMMVCRDEIAGLITGMERPGFEGDREFYLESWNGTGSYTFDRIIRGTIHIPAVTLSILGGIQPGKLVRLVKEATDGGTQSDGLLQRFQLAVWPDSLGKWELSEARESRDVKEAVFSIYETLDRLDREIVRECFGGSDFDGNDEIPALRFSAEAQDLFDQWRSELENRLRSNELASFPAFESHIAKYRSLMPSLALIFHLIGWAASQQGISEDDREGFVGSVGNPSPCSGKFLNGVCFSDAQMAAAWCEYLEAHARKIYAPELQPDLGSARVLADRIREGAVRDGMSVREIYRHDWEGLSSPQDVESAIKVLEDYHWARIEPVASGPIGGRPSKVIRLNPSLIEEAYCA
jgi:putative DNA primase/helicase